MSVKVKGGMYCSRCKRPIAAERTGHAVRNSLGAVLTMGLSLKSEQWHCPICGGTVECEAFRKTAVPPAPVERPEGTVPVSLVHPGTKILPALKVYRRLTGAGLRAARAAFEQVPTLVGYFPPEIASRMRDELEAVGCTVELAEASGSDAAPDLGVAEELAALARLHEAGSLSADEFAAAKAPALGR